MKLSRSWYGVRQLVAATGFVSLPVEATKPVAESAAKMAANELPLRLIDFFTLELVLLAGLVLLALVIVARQPKTH